METPVEIIKILPEANVVISVKNSEDINWRRLNFPYWIMAISLVQIITFYIQIQAIKSVYSYQLLDSKEGNFIVDKFKLNSETHEVWRFLTIMLVHGSFFHLINNVVSQVVIGAFFHSGPSVALIYVCGVFIGSLGFSTFYPESSAVGASGGVFALLFAHFSDFVLNWRRFDKKRFILIGYLALLALFDFLFTPNPIHFFGSIGGFLMGLIAVKSDKIMLNFVVKIAAAFFLFLIIFVAILINTKIKVKV